ncbi:MAG TPA: SPOR domain-containing protein, partial [Xanthobacteraceae bacterium]|nr:SPOR domain-containing protein [Xanthobacteraceae bacterium]
GSSMLPSLPPIIKADNGPNKIVPNKPNPNTADRGDASKAGSAEKLVSREEQPVDMPAPATPAPRVVSTIPIFPDPNPGQAGVPNAAGAGVLGAGGAASVLPAAPPPPPPPQADAAPAAPASSIWPPAPAAAAPVPSSAPASAAPVLGTAPRKIHTVIIRSDQMGAAPAATAAPSVPPPAPLPPPVRTSPPRVAAQPLPRSMPESHAPANAPLSIVPNEGGAPAAPPPRMRTALAQPPTASAPEVRAETAPSAGGGYAVQVTSQRSEADAEAEFRALRTKFPTQLGGHEPIVRRADLGAKGVFYRALVGPYASAEQAAAMCSSLKAAGGNCLVQKD